MNKWIIKYRAANGVAHASVTTDTQEKAEIAFYDHMLETDRFGVIITIAPSE